MKLRADAALDAVVGPEHLRAVGHGDQLIGVVIVMGGRERRMPRWVPVLRQHHRVKIRHQRIDPAQDRVALRHFKRAAGAEIILHVDHDQGMGHGHSPSFKGVGLRIG